MRACLRAWLHRTLTLPASAQQQCAQQGAGRVEGVSCLKRRLTRSRSMTLPPPPPPAVCMNRGRPSPRGRNLYGNQLTGLVPPLPFAQYTNYCYLQYGDPPSNKFACPLPPVRGRRRGSGVHAAAPSLQLIVRVYCLFRSCPAPAFARALQDSEKCSGGPPTCTDIPTPAPAPTPPTPPTPAPCTGDSASLPAAECSAFGDLYDATSGAQWSDCNDSRLDPCG
jgi:hypothetical protein